MNTQQLQPTELGYTEWFVAPSDQPDVWVVARNYDTISTDDRGEICYGMGSDFDSDHKTKEAAEKRWREIVGTMPKKGYTYCSN